MTEDRMPPCPGHHWSPLLPMWIWDRAGELVKHPSLMVRACMACEAAETVAIRTGGHA